MPDCLTLRLQLKLEINFGACFPSAVYSPGYLAGSD